MLKTAGYTTIPGGINSPGQASGLMDAATGFHTMRFSIQTGMASLYMGTTTCLNTTISMM